MIGCNIQSYIKSELTGVGLVVEKDKRVLKLFQIEHRYHNDDGQLCIQFFEVKQAHWLTPNLA